MLLTRDGLVCGAQFHRVDPLPALHLPAASLATHRPLQVCRKSPTLPIKEPYITPKRDLLSVCCPQICNTSPTRPLKESYIALHSP